MSDEEESDLMFFGTPLEPYDEGSLRIIMIFEFFRFCISTK